MEGLFTTLRCRRLIIYPRLQQLLMVVTLFLALQTNNGLRSLDFVEKFFIDEKLSSAMMLGLGKKSTLELLNLRRSKWW
jgi:hypothetical protein